MAGEHAAEDLLTRKNFSDATNLHRSQPLPELIVVAGPTAVGKTAVCVELAKRLGTEIISADSMQVYRKISIGTAKPTAGELQGVACHLIDHVEPDQQYHLGHFVKQAETLVNCLLAKGRVPIICGGTGLYIKGVLEGVFEAGAPDAAVRAALDLEADADGGLAKLHDELLVADPEAARRIPPADRQRVVRALEVFRASGRRISELQSQHGRPWRWRTALFVLDRPRAELYRRIDARVAEMVRLGLLDEVRAYLAGGAPRDCPAIRALGYQELVAHVEGELDLDQALERMRQKSRNFAKRQLTWFRSMTGTIWIDVSGRSPEQTADQILAAAAAAAQGVARHAG